MAVGAPLAGYRPGRLDPNWTASLSQRHDWEKQAAAQRPQRAYPPGEYSELRFSFA